MFEHVGKKNYPEFCRKVSDLLDDDGVFVLHAVGRVNDPGPVNPFIRKYIFPGTDVPTLGEVLPVIEDAMLVVTDVEVLRLHYAETLRSEEHTSELQSLMRISYAVFCLKKKKKK